jgi:hypothetical protein
MAQDLVYAVWFATFLTALVWLTQVTQGFDAWPLGIGVVAFISVLFGAIFGLVVSIVEFHMRRRAD